MGALTVGAGGDQLLIIGREAEAISLYTHLPLYPLLDNRDDVFTGRDC